MYWSDRKRHLIEVKILLKNPIEVALSELFCFKVKLLKYVPVRQCQPKIKRDSLSCI